MVINGNKATLVNCLEDLLAQQVNPSTVLLAYSAIPLDSITLGLDKRSFYNPVLLQAENPECLGCNSCTAEMTQPLHAQQFFPSQNQSTTGSVKDPKDYSKTDNK